tara:strand:- start:7007 stop:7561 length:555 start_codon:yes stop_codon:yes gene_type:complete
VNLYKTSNLDIKMIYMCNERSLDESWKSELFERVKFFAKSRAKKYEKNFYSEDFLQEAYCGLWSALSTFDYHKNFDFYRWAQWHISKRLRDFHSSYMREFELKSNTYNDVLMETAGENIIDKVFLSQILEDNSLSLSHKEITILKQSYLKGKTLSEIGSSLSLSAERVRQIKKESLHVIKENVL